MEGFTEKNGVLHVDDIPLAQIAEQFGTPTYVYSAAIIRRQYNALKNAMQKALPADRQPMLCYACKANSNIAIEIVSEGELFRGLKAGFKGNQIISTSFGKNEPEIRACLEADILQFNIESPEELEHVNLYSGKMNKKAQVLFRINPNVKGGGHSKISTGGKEHKFGNHPDDILALYTTANKMDHVQPVGLSVHIGSQVSTVESFKPSFEKLAELVQILRSKGLKVMRLDIGGGFPIIYNDEELLDLDLYAQWVRDIILPLDTEIQMEPGRYMVGNSGVLLARTEYVKKTPTKNFLVLDAGMNDLMRPALYDAYHGIRPVMGHNAPKVTYDVVGPICESGDVFTKDREIAEVSKGDLVVLETAGAYGFAMASNYNTRPLPAEVMVDGNKIAIIRQRQTLDDLVRGETIPDWL
jgi:diaminopimelate decarboxylase